MVSVIVPMYNSGKYIAACIDSILMQNADKEIILVNDGSTDDTEEICQAYADRFNCIRYFHKDNSGVSDTRNYGLSKARGKYITFVDSDDLLTEESLNILINTIESKKVDVVYGNHSYFYDGDIVKRIPRIPEKEYCVDELKNRLIDDGTLTGILFGSVWGAIYKKEIIDKHNIRFAKDVIQNEDGIFNIEYLMHSSCIYMLGEPVVYLYRQWKNANKTELTVNQRTAVATDKIKKVISGWMEEDALSAQLRCRTISMAFWDSLKVAGENITYKTAKPFLKEVLSNENVRNGFQYLNYKSMNRYKRVLSHMMKYRLYLLYYVAVHYVYQFLNNKVKR